MEQHLHVLCYTFQTKWVEGRTPAESLRSSGTGCFKVVFAGCKREARAQVCDWDTLGPLLEIPRQR